MMAYTIRVRINGRQSQPVVVINKADPQNSPNPGDGRNAMAGENAIRPGNDIGEAVKAMAESGYKETGLDLLATKVDTDLRMWAVGEGVLILAYSNKDKKVHGMSYYLCDERPKATRKTFDLIVKEFDPKTRELKITLPNHPNHPAGNDP